MKSKLANGVLKGDRNSIARAISLVENRREGFEELLESLGNLGKAFVLGVTGPLGTGKSTLIDILLQRYRRDGLSVGVIATDPTSPLTGGALLGDRVRMSKHTEDAGIYIRSMASRGWSGGLSSSTADVIQILDAAGTDVVLVETVGAGQSDTEIVRMAHAVVVVLMPGLGDDIQASKAGLMEVGDVYVVNKSDLEGADRMVLNLVDSMRNSRSRPTVIKVSALKGDGIDRLYSIVEAFRSKLDSEEGRSMKLRSIKGMMLEIARGKALLELNRRTLLGLPERLAEDVLDKKMGLRKAAERLTKRE